LLAAGQGGGGAIGNGRAFTAYVGVVGKKQVIQPAWVLGGKKKQVGREELPKEG